MNGTPRPQGRRDRIAGYALGMVHETAWILGLSLLAFALAGLAKVIWP